MRSLSSGLPNARATLRKLSARGKDRSIAPAASRLTTSFFIYISGACNRLSRGAKAMTASALLCPIATIRVPSMGSTAISTSGPSPLPTSSPIHSIGAWSISPSPITTRPRKATSFNAWRIAVTARPSILFLSPHPVCGQAANAACSVTRNNGHARDIIARPPQYQRQIVPADISRPVHSRCRAFPQPAAPTL